jgi:hypothetical protein
MITLCEEALRQREALVRFKDSISTILRSNRADPLMTITLIEGELALLQIPPCDNIIAENVHFRHRRKENLSNRNRMRRRRGGEASDGIQPNAPHSLIRPLTGADLDLLAEYEKWNRGEG